MRDVEKLEVVTYNQPFTIKREMSKYYNDVSIESTDADSYGVTPSAESIANSIRGLKSLIGTDIALNGHLVRAKTKTW